MTIVTAADASSVNNGSDNDSCQWLKVYRQGLPARRPVPAQPASAPEGLAGRIEEWVRVIQPRNILERELAERAAHLSWTLEQAQKAETAINQRRARDAADREAAQAEILGRRLLGELPAPKPRGKGQGAGGNLPAVLRRRLEATAEGCRWLLDRWSEFATVVASGGPFTDADLFRLIRLLGKEPIDAVYDSEIHRLLTACDRHRAGMGQRFFEACRARIPPGDPAFRDQRTWRSLIDSRTQAEPGALGEFLLDWIARQSARLSTKIRRHEASTVPMAVEAPAVVPSRTLERLQRLQINRSRELRQIIEQLRKLRAGGRRREDNGPTARSETPAGDARHRQVSASLSTNAHAVPKPSARQVVPVSRPLPPRSQPPRSGPRVDARRVAPKPNRVPGTPPRPPATVPGSQRRRVRSPVTV